MRIGLLVLSVGKFGNKGFYNLQEVGLAKAFGNQGHTVEVYKCVGKDAVNKREKIAENVHLNMIAVPTVGNNSVFSCEKRLSRDLDVLVCFSDVQIRTSAVYRWARRHGIVFIPYVGITHSTSTSFFKRLLSEVFSGSVFNTYKKSGVLSKTKTVERELKAKGITDVQTVTVGLDFDLLHKDYRVPSDPLKAELHLDPALKYILMVGRLESDRDPLQAVSVLEALHQADPRYRLIVIGKGSLKSELSAKLENKGLSSLATWIEQVPNSEMWKYYRTCEALVSFSKTEIFGMSILEAMYYELPVYVIHAPGPDEIITDRETGYLFHSPLEMPSAILSHCDPALGEKAHRYVVSRFSWDNMVRTVIERTTESMRHQNHSSEER